MLMLAGTKGVNDLLKIIRVANFPERKYLALKATSGQYILTDRGTNQKLGPLVRIAHKI